MFFYCFFPFHFHLLTVATDDKEKSKDSDTENLSEKEDAVREAPSEKPEDEVTDPDWEASGGVDPTESQDEDPDWDNSIVQPEVESEEEERDRVRKPVIADSSDDDTPLVNL